MTDDTRNISVVVRASNAIRELTKVGISLQDMGSAVGKSNSELTKMDRQLRTTQKAVENATTALFKAKTELKQLGASATVNAQTIRSLESRLGTANKRIAEYKVKLQDARMANGILAKSNEDLAKALDKSGAAAERSGQKVGNGAKSAKKALEDLDKNVQLNALRYALYDVGNSLSRIRDLSASALGGVFNTGIEFQKNFANVLRTSQVSDASRFSDPVAATNALRDAFLDLQSTIPVTSEELTRIGTLAAQMGIASSEVAEFTEITAKFSAASGITADEAATALARVSQMLSGDVKGDYERLASAILKTGVNAIATEQQIVRGTTQIAAIGKVAGFSAVEIVALSSAMSSLGMSPELQRSIVTSSFTKILTAVRGSSEEAEKFGRILGMTGREFQDAWEGDGYNTYRQLLAAIAQSPNAIGLLKDLGLASQRLTPNLLKLGQSYDLLGDTLRDTQQGWNEDIELQRQYQIIADTTAAKLQVLGQAWDAFLTIMGSGAVDILGDVAGAITDIVKNLQAFASSQVGKVISTLVIAVTILATAIFGVVTAVAVAGAAFLGFDYVLTQLTAAALASATGVSALNLSIDGLALKSAGSKIGVIALSGALKVLLSPLSAVVAGLALLTAGISNEAEITKWDRSIKGLATDIATLKGELTGDIDTKDMFGLGRAFESIDDNINAFQAGNSRGLGGFATAAWGSIRLLDEQLKVLAQKSAPEANAILQELRSSWIEGGKSAESFTAAFPDTIEALSLLTGATGATTEEIDQYMNAQSDASTLEEERSVQVAGMADALGLLTNGYADAEEALSAYVDAFKSGAGEFFDIGGLLGAAYGTEEGQGGGLSRFKTDLDAQLVIAKKWADGISELTARGAGSLAVAFAEQGPASQQAVTDALTLDGSSLAALEQSMADAAFFASTAYANAFAADNAVLADVYKKALAIDPATALEAVHEARDALTSGGGILDPATLAALESKYGIKINLDLVPEMDEEALATAQAVASAKPIKLPVKPTITDQLGAPSEGGEGPLSGMLSAWQVELDGHTLIMPIDPNTEEGRALIAEWRANEYATPVSLQTWADTSGAQRSMDAFRLQQANAPINVRVNAIGAGAGQANSAVATGGLIGKRGNVVRSNYPAFASGTILRGPGTGTSDSILARVSTGEAITRAAAVRHYGTRFFEDINKMRFPKFASGGFPGGGGAGAGSYGAPNVSVSVTQMYPTTRDPIKTLKQDAEAVLAGIWT